MDNAIARYDGARHWMLVLCHGLEGGDIVPHGDPRRFDWSVTMMLLARCQAWAKQ